MPPTDFRLTANIIILKCNDSIDAWKVFELLKHAENTGESKPFYVTWVYSSFYRAVYEIAKKRGFHRNKTLGWDMKRSKEEGVESSI